MPPLTPRRIREGMFASSHVAVNTSIAGWARGIRDALKGLLKPSSAQFIPVGPGGGHRPGLGAVSDGPCRRERAAAPAAAVMRQRARRRSRPAAHRASPLRRSSEDRGQRSCNHASAGPTQLLMGAGPTHRRARHTPAPAQTALQTHLATQIETQEGGSAAFE